MSLADYALIALIGGYCLCVIFGRKKKGGCCGDCARCGGCKNGKDMA